MAIRKAKRQVGMRIDWEEGFEIGTTMGDGMVRIAANKEGLVSLANILLALAEKSPGSHIHLDEDNSLEDGSCELVIERV